MNSPIFLLSSGLPSFCGQTVRTKGIHWSDVIYDLCKTNECDYQFSGMEDLMTLGRVMEWSLKENYHLSFPGEAIDLGEICYQGIYMHPDVYWISDNAIEEDKYTSRSSSGPDVPIGQIAPPDHPIYGDKFYINWLQAAGYCVGVGQGYIGCNTAYLSLIHYRGDYKGLNVVHKRWKRVFPPEELERLWTMGKQHADENFCYSCGRKYGKGKNGGKGDNTCQC